MLIIRISDHFDKLLSAGITDVPDIDAELRRVDKSIMALDELVTVSTMCVTIFTQTDNYIKEASQPISSLSGLYSSPELI